MDNLSKEALLALLVATTLALAYLLFKLKAHFSKGALAGAWLIDDRIVLTTILHQASGGGLSSVSGGGRSTRLKIVHHHTGKTLGRKIIPRHAEVQLVVNGILWMTLNRARYGQKADQELLAFDPFSMRIVFDQQKLKRNLNLSSRDNFHSLQFEQNTGILAVITSTGLRHTFDCKTLHAQGTKTDLVQPTRKTPVNALQAGVFHFEKTEQDLQYQLYVHQRLLLPEARFLQPTCLATTSTNRRNTVLLFAHRQSLQEDAETHLSTARSESPTHAVLLSVVPTENRRVEIALFAENSLHFFVSVLHTRRDLILAVDQSTGAISWWTKS